MTRTFLASLSLLPALALVACESPEPEEPGPGDPPVINPDDPDAGCPDPNSEPCN